MCVTAKSDGCNDQRSLLVRRGVGSASIIGSKLNDASLASTCSCVGLRFNTKQPRRGVQNVLQNRLCKTFCTPLSVPLMVADRHATKTIPCSSVHFLLAGFMNKADQRNAHRGNGKARHYTFLQCRLAVRSQNTLFIFTLVSSVQRSE